MHETVHFDVLKFSVCLCCVCVCVCMRACTHMHICMCGMEIFAMCAIHLAIITENAIPITFQPNSY